MAYKFIIVTLLFMTSLSNNRSKIYAGVMSRCKNARVSALQSDGGNWNLSSTTYENVGISSCVIKSTISLALASCISWKLDVLWINATQWTVLWHLAVTFRSPGLTDCILLVVKICRSTSTCVGTVCQRALDLPVARPKSPKVVSNNVHDSANDWVW